MAMWAGQCCKHARLAAAGLGGPTGSPEAPSDVRVAAEAPHESAPHAEVDKVVGVRANDADAT